MASTARHWCVGGIGGRLARRWRAYTGDCTSIAHRMTSGARSARRSATLTHTNKHTGTRAGMGGTGGRWRAQQVRARRPRLRACGAWEAPAGDGGRGEYGRGGLDCVPVARGRHRRGDRGPRLGCAGLLPRHTQRGRAASTARLWRVGGIDVQSPFCWWIGRLWAHSCMLICAFASALGSRELGGSTSTPLR